MPLLAPPHSLRHSGPARDVLNNTRSLEEIRRRGRWASLKSVQRYTKSHLLIHRESLLDDAAKSRGQLGIVNLKHFLQQALNKASISCTPFNVAVCDLIGASPIKPCADLNLLSIHDLRRLAKQRGLEGKGRKRDLILRISASFIDPTQTTPMSTMPGSYGAYLG